MLSRAAESIYWLHRYIERAENVARFIDVNLHLVLDLSPDSPEQWQPLVNTTGDRHDFAQRYGAACREHVFTFLTHDAANPNSILSCLQAARDNARSVREIISSDMWEHVNKFYLMVQQRGTAGAAGAARFLQRGEERQLPVRGRHRRHHGARRGLALRAPGAAAGARRQDLAHSRREILHAGRRRSSAGSPVDDIQWAAVLKSASALEMYRQRFGRITPDSVADFLLLDREFPRALHYCLVEAETSLHLISGTPMGSFRDEAEQRLGRLRSELDYAAIGEIIAVGLHAFLDRFQFKLNQVDDEIFNTFFALRPARRDAARRVAETWRTAC